MRNIGRSLALLALSTVSYAALGQALLSIQNGKPETPVVGLPFSADQSVRLVQHLGNGMTLTREIKGRIYRSADGVERLDGTAVAIDFAQTNQTTQVWIVDRAKHTAVLLNSKLMTATVTHLPADATVTVSFLPQPRTSGPASAAVIKPENMATTELGKRTQDGMDLVGKRMTGTIPAGKVGNDQPILVTTDEWVAPQLKIVVNEVEQNPLVGERIFELSNIIRSEEPDPRLFEVPKGYALKEQPSFIPNAPARLGAVPDPKTRQIQDALNSPSAAIKNEVAHSLASGNTFLSDAQTLAEQAVRMEEQQTANLDPKGAGADAFRHMLILSQYWNTLGWVYFRQGKLDQAEAYTRAAWELEPQGFVCVHLGRIYEQRNRPQEAIAIYRMGLAAEADPTEQEQIQSRLIELGAPVLGPLPVAVTTPLSSLTAPPQAGENDTLIDMILSRDRPPVVSILQGSPALKESVTKAIQVALAAALPDSGPEKVLRRARVNCTTKGTPACSLHFISSQQGLALLLHLN